MVMELWAGVANKLDELELEVAVRLAEAILIAAGALAELGLVSRGWF